MPRRSRDDIPWGGRLVEEEEEKREGVLKGERIPSREGRSHRRLNDNDSSDSIGSRSTVRPSTDVRLFRDRFRIRRFGKRGHLNADTKEEGEEGELKPRDDKLRLTRLRDCSKETSDQPERVEMCTI